MINVQQSLLLQDVLKELMDHVIGLLTQLKQMVEHVILILHVKVLLQQHLNIVKKYLKIVQLMVQIV